jgi:hypothetical protein
MYRHQHTPLPLEQLKDVPQPVVILLEKLLEKDPAQRFETPNQLLKAIPTVTGAIDARRRITPQSLQKTPSTASRAGIRKPPPRLGPKKISVARLPVTGSDIFGREEDLGFLDRAGTNKDVNVVGRAGCLTAWTGRALFHGKLLSPVPRPNTKLSIMDLAESTVSKHAAPRRR